MSSTKKRRAVIVSGGTYGIGREITLELAREGWPVVAFGLDQRQPGSRAENGSGATRDALAQAGCTADVLEADVSSASDVQRIVDHSNEKHGGVTAVVNNAAIRPTGGLLETDLDTFERVLAVNLAGPQRLSRAAIPHMQAAGFGTLINLGSAAASGRAGLAAYSASKAGLHAMTLAWAQELRESGIRVHLVVPAPGTPSGMVEAIRVEARQASRDSQAQPATSASDVARVVAYLLSHDHDVDTVIDVADWIKRSATSNPR